LIINFTIRELYMNIRKEILGPMRVPFLILTPACVLLGIATAVRTGAPINPLHVLLILIGAVCTHISVNAFNEYDDFKSGLDSHTQRTPFSGGSGTLQADPGMAKTALATALVTLGIVILTGIYFTWLRGPALLPLGLLGILTIVVYAPWLTASALALMHRVWASVHSWSWVPTSHSPTVLLVSVCCLAIPFF
jgi:1,4-dihydroxy-2-naphthoate octaprenyltransferase